MTAWTMTRNAPTRRFSPRTDTANRMQQAGCSAFTLLEVLVALALFAAVSALIAQTCANLLQSRWVLSASQRGDHAFEQWAINEILTTGSRDDLESGGSFNLPDQRSVAWNAHISPVGMIDTFNVALQLEWRDGQNFVSRVHGIDVHVYRPGWMTPQEREGIMRERENKWQELIRERNLPIQ